ncbi:MAG: hypothetical protein C0483_20710 [Pirellula sp.]|nr:hypothetical protein [Pirellula sp.]
MRNPTLIIAALALVSACFSDVPTADGAVPVDWRQDAELSSIALVDASQAWACGDHGVVLHTADGGATWVPQASGVDCRLHCIYFVDARNGWIVGGGYDPYVHRSRGVVLRTTDGGANWQPEPTALVPLLRKIHMDNLREGWAVGDVSPLSTGGVFFTRDGGKTWSGAGGQLPAGVTAADFLSPAEAVCADGRGRVVRMENRLVQATPAAAFGLRSVRDLRISSNGRGWFVGDGGLVQRSTDAGRSWQVPGQDLAQGPGAQCDWRALAVCESTQGSKLWIVGAPGSVVLHSADDGASWQLLPTGQPLPLNDVAFLDEQHGIAVGALGVILATDDGGRTWSKQSRGEKRPALWACFADPQSMPAELLALAAAEEGYRTAVTLLGRRDVEPGVDDGAPTHDRYLEGVSALGAASGSQSWAFPLRQQPLQPAAETVLAAWGAGEPAAGVQLAEAHLVRMLRMWRPDVVLTHGPSPRGDAPTTHLLHQLVLQAVEAAGDPARFPEQIQHLGLATWQPRKAFGYEPGQTSGSISLKRDQVMARTALSLDDFSERFRSLVHDERTPRPLLMTCRMVWNRTASAAAPRELFAGIELPIGGDARRPAAIDDAENRVRMRRTAERQRNLEAIVMQRSGAVGAGLLDQIRALTAGQDETAAGDTVFHLAESFRLRGRWEAARETYELLLTRYPQHRSADAALRRMTQYFASGEADRRLRRTLEDLGPQSTAKADEATTAPTTTEPKLTSIKAAEPTEASTLAQRSGEAPPQTANFDKLHITVAASAPTITNAPIVATPAARLLGKEPDLLKEDVAAPAAEPSGGRFAEPLLAGAADPLARRRRALALSAYYAQRDPTAHAAPEIGFPTAAARRALGQAAEAEQFYDEFARTQAEGAWQAAASDELALARGTLPKRRMLAAPRAGERPVLDGRLDDAVWRSAPPITLASPLGDDAAWPANVWIASDDEYLYVAIRCRRTGPAAPLPAGVRQRDADLAPHDRVEVYLDTDRDYATYYRLAVDCRGWTAESCWDDPTWDPKWFVAAGGDDEIWVVEAAIPWRELAEKRPAIGEAWAVGIQRISPLVGLQSWTFPATTAVRPEGFGYLTFE